jgi:hypothetical protein
MFGESNSMFVMTTPERQPEDPRVENRRGLQYEHFANIRDRAPLEKNLRGTMESLHHVHLTDREFRRLRNEIIAPDHFAFQLGVPRFRQSEQRNCPVIPLGESDAS